MAHFKFLLAGCLLLVVVTSVESKNRVANDVSGNYRNAKKVRQTSALPGRNKSFVQQCREFGSQEYAGVCAVDVPAKRCEKLICADTREGDLPAPHAIGPALDGTPCGHSKICLNKYCVEDDSTPTLSTAAKDFEYDCENWEDDVPLPGRYKSFGEQCQDSGYGGICSTQEPEKRCVNIVCAITDRGDIPFSHEIGSALDGTKCGENKICVSGACVEDKNPPPKNFKTSMDFQYDCEDTSA